MLITLADNFWVTFATKFQQTSDKALPKFTFGSANTRFSHSRRHVFPLARSRPKVMISAGDPGGGGGSTTMPRVGKGGGLAT